MLESFTILLLASFQDDIVDDWDDFVDARRTWNALVSCMCILLCVSAW